MTHARYGLRVVSLWVKARDTPGEYASSPEEATSVILRYFERMRDDRERMIALGLTSMHAVLGVVEVAVGGQSASAVDPKVLFRTLLVMGASRFILAHNHPSGDPTPSQKDLAMTRQIRRGGKLLELPCMDHLIVGDGTNRVHSFLEHGEWTLLTEDIL